MGSGIVDSGMFQPLVSINVSETNWKSPLRALRRTHQRFLLFLSSFLFGCSSFLFFFLICFYATCPLDCISHSVSGEVEEEAEKMSDERYEDDFFVFFFL